MSSIKSDLKQIYTAAIQAVDPYNAVKNFIKLKNNKIIINDKNGAVSKIFNYKSFKNIYVVGAGKATAKMAKAIEEIFFGHLSGVVLVKYGYTEKLKYIKCLEAAHPLPDSAGIYGALKIKEILYTADKDDLVISLISGGASSLLPLPAGSIKLTEKQKITDLLIKSGAAIHEINCIRKHLSEIKGGNAARYAYPATIINLMVSDVVDDKIEIIGSGPFIADNSSFQDALIVLDKYLKKDKVPVAIRKYLINGANGQNRETPKKQDKCFKNIYNCVIASNIIALQAAANESKELGYNTIILSSSVEGEAKDVAIVHAAIAKEIFLSANPVNLPACVLSGGETTVTVKGKGLGGRNMEFAMQSALYIDGIKNGLIASIGTDGGDGPTDAAGAIVDGDFLQKCRKFDVDIRDYINNNDSYNLFNKVGGLIKTGPTNTNVMDLRIILLQKQSCNAK